MHTIKKKYIYIYIHIPKKVQCANGQGLASSGDAVLETPENAKSSKHSEVLLSPSPPCSLPRIGPGCKLTNRCDVRYCGGYIYIYINYTCWNSPANMDSCILETKNGGPPCTTEMAHLKNPNPGIKGV